MKKQLLLLVAMLLPLVAIADASGTCGANLTWTYTEATHTLTIEGSGAMTDYNYSSKAPWFSYKDVIEKIIIGPNATTIGSYAFEGLSKVTYVYIHGTVTIISSNAFYGCSGLTSITIPNSVLSICDYAFEGCSGLTSIKVDSGNTMYDSRDDCNAIIETKSNTLRFGCQNTTIPNSVKKIGGGAFRTCTGLTSITIPNSVTSIGSEAFLLCTGLTSITIPNSVTSIGMGVFGGCFSLTFISIGNGVNNISSGAFSQCSNLQDLYLYAEQAPTTDTGAFYNANTANATLHVPANMLFVYQSITPWKDFGTIVAIDSDPEVPGPQKCEKPTISYVNGKLTFTSSTRGATCQYSITDSDVKSGNGGEVQLTATYNISVYATKEGYENSETATATLCWIDVEPKTEGISNGIAQVPAKAVLIQAAGGTINVQGCDDGERVSIYSINGSQVGTAVSQNGVATVNTTLQLGSIAIVMIGQKSVKVIMK